MPDDAQRDYLTTLVSGVCAHREELDSYIEKAAQWLKDGKTFGLLLCGVPGNGKTTLMRAIQTCINMLDLKDDFNRDMGLAIIDSREIARLNRDSYEQFKAYRNRQMLGIDDLGLEPTEVLDYGNILSPVIDLLSYRYNEQLFTVITTNLRPQEIREKYKDRIADRFNEMMTKIIFKNPSYRGQNAQKIGFPAILSAKMNTLSLERKKSQESAGKRENQ